MSGRIADKMMGPFRSGGRGDGDIWVATRIGPDAPFGEPINLNDFGLGIIGDIIGLASTDARVHNVELSFGVGIRF